MWEDHLQSCLAAATCEERTDMSNWERVVEILQLAFRDSKLHMECMWQKVVLIPKGNGEFVLIGLVKVLWKALSGVINRQIGVVVQFHNVLHGFQAGQETGTTSLESKLLQQLTEMKEEVLYGIFFVL